MTKETFNKISEIFNIDLYPTDKDNLGYLTNFYDNFLIKIKNKPITFMEIGVGACGSIKLWRDYLHPKSKIYAADIKYFDHIENTISIIGDMYSEKQISKFSDEYFDIIIDDGPHTFESFSILIEKYFSKLKTGGTLIIEDVINFEWVEPLCNLSTYFNYSSYEVFDMNGKQKNSYALSPTVNGLYILVLTK